MKKNNKSNTIFWIIGFLFPLLGLVFYFLYKNKDESKSSKSIKGAITSFILLILSGGILLIFITTHPTNYYNRDVDEWYKDITSGNTVVTVLGASYCEHCQALKPVITSLAKKNKINLYFYEIDTLTDYEYDKLTNSFELEGYTKSVPYIFIMKDNSFIGQTTGYNNESVLQNFLWEYGLIKD